MKKYLGKITFAIILTFSILATVLCLSTISAEEKDNSGIQWTLENLNTEATPPTATIAGATISGQTKRFTIPSVVSKDGVDYTITAIKKDAFSGDSVKKLVFGELKLPDTLKTIGEGAFKGTFIYGDVAIPNSVTEIGKSAFEGCKGILSVTFSSDGTSQLKEIKESTFKSCVSLNTVNNTENIEVFSKTCFADCSALLNISFSNNTKEIGEEAFINCVSLNSSYDLSAVQTLGNKCFYNCYRIKGITIPDHAENFTAFDGCYSIESYSVSSTHPSFVSLDGVVFNKDMDLLYLYPPCKDDAVYTVPSSVKVIGRGAFKNTTKLDRVIFPSTLERIEPESFRNSSIKDAYIPENIPALSVDTFYGCSELEWVVLGESVNVVGVDAFRDTDTKIVIAKNNEVFQPKHVDTFYNASGYKCVEHFYGYFDKAATCQSDGYKTCVLCSRITLEKAIPHTGILLGSFEKTCTEDAYDLIDCFLCGEQEKLIKEYAPGHRPTVTTVPQKLGTPGYTVNRCLDCKETYITDYNASFKLYGDVDGNGAVNSLDQIAIDKYINNNDLTINTKYADINKDGVIDQEDSTLLSNYFARGDELPTDDSACDGHKNVKTLVVSEASCITSGLSITYCADCGVKLSENKTALQPCQLKTVSLIQSSCKNNGKKTVVCQVCGTKSFTILDLKPHTHDWYTIESQRGYEYSSCKVCSTFESRTVDYSTFDLLISRISPYRTICYTSETNALLAPIILNHTMTLTQEAVDKNVRELEDILANIQYKVTDVPTVYIEIDPSQNNTDVLKRDMEYIPATIYIAYLDENGVPQIEAADINGQMKVRGNSTAEHSNKFPYNIKFSSKTDLFGMGASKKYSLLANYKDPTFIKNALTFDLSSMACLDIANSCKYEIVDVYRNGVYYGAYMLTTTVDVGEDRVDIDEDNDYLFEIEKEGGNGLSEPGNLYMKTPLIGIYILVESPEDMSAESYSNLFKSLLNIDHAILSGDWELIQEYVDVENIAKYYILHDYLKDVDIVWDSTRFYIEDGKLHGGPAWDFDLALDTTGGGTASSERMYYDNEDEDHITEGGILKDGTTGVWASCTWLDGTDRIWFTSLYKNSPEFVKYLCQKVIEYEDKLTIIYEDGVDEDGETVENIIDSIVYDEAINGSLDRNRVLFSNPNFYDNVEELRAWLKARTEWMINYYSRKLESMQ